MPVTDQPLLLVLGAAVLIPLAILSLYPSRVLRYLQRKRYQYEVTFSLYMMTPTEKFIFNSILFLFVSMVLIAAALYLPTNTANVARRAWYYLGGDDAATSTITGLKPTASAVAADFLSASAARARDVVVEASARAAAAVA
ncbi:hypothetical protein K461DRAFT_275280 [Myriangium duriaei CBS 260.36]|uniref:Uncharacterized protein n=1 Tax=Myriangium duriaei CBS 260.36 TaxID=1168546 RepID=A0A9P4JBX4_9PEZI|nr:hypothetical protein K461DRAFT_275280 [Myriangium duriaei CBS 260.36]